MKGGIIHLHDMMFIGIRLTKLLQKDLEAIAIHMGAFPTEALTGSRFNGTVQPIGFALPLMESDGFDAR